MFLENDNDSRADLGVVLLDLDALEIKLNLLVFERAEHLNPPVDKLNLDFFGPVQRRFLNLVIHGELVLVDEGGLLLGGVVEVFGGVIVV